ncbi:MAG: hypothetical protein ACK55O_12315 [Phycisphaerales bacterium]|nr:hypothetical protein [Phycisphaeraceae bacterium]
MSAEFIKRQIRIVLSEDKLEARARCSIRPSRPNRSMSPRSAPWHPKRAC